MTLIIPLRGDEKVHVPAEVLYSIFSAVDFCEEQQVIVCCANETRRVNKKTTMREHLFIEELVWLIQILKQDNAGNFRKVILNPE